MLVNPKAVCVDSEQRLLVVESHVRRLHILDWHSERARPINRIELGDTLDFPVHIGVNNQGGRIFIADHNAHAIKVFDYSGGYCLQLLYLQLIHPSLTYYLLLLSALIPLWKHKERALSKSFKI